MVILQIEHKIPNFDGWKKAFDSDPNYVIINLEFDELEKAESALGALRNLWGKVEGKIMMDPQTRILDLIECTEI